MKTTPQKFSNVSRIACAVVLMFMSVLPSLLPSTANAAQITTRSLTLVANGTTGGSLPGGVVHHAFGFTTPTNGTVGSIKFEYCTTAAGTCTMPTGLVTTSATIGSQSFSPVFTLNNTTNGAPYLTRTAANLTPGAFTVQLNTITNPTVVAGVSFIVRITTYASIDTTGASTDIGNVTASTNRAIILNGVMPESLVFCTGQTVSTTAGVPDCTTATSGAIDFNQLFSPVDTAVANSQMAASTNAGSGYAITVNGTTMTSGSNTVTALGTPSASIKGVSQFGLNLRANTTAAATCWPTSCGFAGVYDSKDVTTVSNGTNLRAEPKTGYDTADTFTFNNGAVVADSSDSSVTPLPTDAQIYTASYIVNVPGSQPAGTYTATMTYICTPTF